MNRVINFAREELNRYFFKMTGSENNIQLVLTKNDENVFEESFCICVDGDGGKISGVNGRSVLLGVYRFLRELGCKFLYPGADGEIIPVLSTDNVCVHVDFTSAITHRGLTLEGGCSCEHVANFIDWGVKNGFNSYFIQFRTGYTFFERWANHDFNPYAERQPFNDQIALDINKKLRNEIKKRGMIFHAVGHGWTCEPFGIPSRGWDEVKELPDDCERYFALVNGKREFYKGIPLNTNLCYSNSEVRKMVIDNVVEYINQNSDVDVLHLWLGDNYNNFCECENCAKQTPSDWYVVLLNELDERLTHLKIQVKVVFLAYFELLYKPTCQKIKNQDRFILMFAPITRTYDRSLADFVDEARTKEVTPLKLNHFVPPVDSAENMRHLFDWQQCFGGDSFMFDYPLMWDGCKEYGGITLAKTIYDDAHTIQKMGLNGYVSCQIQRMFFPTGFPMYVMGAALFDQSLSYEQIRQDYFSSAYGEYGDRIYEILSEVSSYKIYDYMRNLIPFNSSDMHKQISQIKQRIATFKEETVTMLQNNNSPVVMRHLVLIKKLFEFLSYITLIIEEKTGENDQNKADAILRKLQLEIFEFEPFCDQRFNGGYFYTHIDEMAHRKEENK